MSRNIITAAVIYADDPKHEGAAYGLTVCLTTGATVSGAVKAGWQHSSYLTLWGIDHEPTYVNYDHVVAVSVLWD